MTRICEVQKHKCQNSRLKLQNHAIQWLRGFRAPTSLLVLSRSLTFFFPHWRRSAVNGLCFPVLHIWRTSPYWSFRNSLGLASSILSTHTAHNWRGALHRGTYLYTGCLCTFFRSLCTLHLIVYGIWHEQDNWWK